MSEAIDFDGHSVLVADHIQCHHCGVVGLKTDLLKMPHASATCPGAFCFGVPAPHSVAALIRREALAICRPYQTGGLVVSGRLEYVPEYPNLPDILKERRYLRDIAVFDADACVAALSYCDDGIAATVVSQCMAYCVLRRLPAVVRFESLDLPQNLSQLGAASLQGDLNNRQWSEVGSLLRRLDQLHPIVESLLDVFLYGTSAISDLLFDACRLVESDSVSGSRTAEEDEYQADDLRFFLHGRVYGGAP